MPAQIIATEDGQERVYWIEDEVVRIGTDPICELPLEDPTIAAHAITLEYADGRYKLHNRTESPIVLDGSPCRRKGAVLWQDGMSLQLSASTVLRLETEDDPAPGARHPVDLLGDQGDDVDPDESGEVGDETGPSVSPSARRVQFGVIATCLLAIPILLISAQGSDPAPSTPPISLETVIASLDEEDAAPSPALAGLRELRESLQAARFQELRGQDRRALSLYRVVRDRLDSLRRGDGTFLTHFEQIAYDYSIARIAMLTPR
jgi:hypothetical protein